MTEPLKEVPLDDAELDVDYWVEFGWEYLGKYRKPAYRGRVLDKNLSGGKVRLRREVLGPNGRGSVWEDVVHPREDLFIFEIPEWMEKS